jgi:hypothetical protein
MKKQTAFTAVAAALTLGLALPAAADSKGVGGPPAGAGERGKPLGIACQQAGIDTLQSLGLLATVASDGIEVVGLGNVPFETVLSLHRTTPEAFQTAENPDDQVKVVVPGVGEVAATWCDNL